MAASNSNGQRVERRRYRRDRVSAIATVNYGKVLLPCFLADISAGGVRIKLLEPAQLPKGPTVLETRQLGKLAAELVWQKGLFAGLKFTEAKVPFADSAPSSSGAAAPPAPAPMNRATAGA